MYKKIVLFMILTYVFIGVIACGKAVEEKPQPPNIQEEITAVDVEAKKQENTEEETTRTEEVRNEEYVQYEDRSVVFTYPASWSLEILQGEDGRNVIFSETKEAKIPILIYETGEAWRFDLENTKEYYDEIFNDIYPELEIIELSNITIDGFATHKLVFTYNAEGQEFTQTQYSLAGEGLFHEFRYTYLTEMKESYEEKIEKIVETIDFIAAE